MNGGLAELIVSLVVVAILLWWGASQPDKEQKKKASKPNKVTQSIMKLQAKWEKKAEASEKAALLQKEHRQRDPDYRDVVDMFSVD